MYTRDTSHTLYEQCVGSMTFLRIYCMYKDCGTGPKVYRPYPRRTESLQVSFIQYPTFTRFILRQSKALMAPANRNLRQKWIGQT